MRQSFIQRNKFFIKKITQDKRLKELSKKWFNHSVKYEYSYHFRWLGRPIIQYPQDILALQEIIWKVKPDLIIETGIARGGSLVFYASLLELIGKGKVLGIDIDIRYHSKKAIEKHKMFKRIIMIEGSSVAKEVVSKIKKVVKRYKKVMVCLDSLHTHDHVLKELSLYSKFVTKNSYLVVFDTCLEEMPKTFFKSKPWGRGNNPKTAVAAFLKIHKNFVIDKTIEEKLLITTCPSGYLKRIT
jgi:cephalosporin hydroxylase